MNMNEEKVAPYAPLSNIIGLIRRRRDKGMPEVLNTQELIRMGISEGNIARTLQALRFLNLVDEEGRQTKAFNRIARASTSEYPEILGEILKEAYSDVFTIIDPAEATDIEFVDAFRFYQPQKQRSRMILLFRGLCQETGLIEGGPPETRKRGRVTKTNKLPSQPQVNAALKAQSHIEEPPQSPNLDSYQSINRKYALLEALLRQLPEDRRWTKEQRDRWLQALTANVDLLVDVVEAEDEV
jgi:hypothetical protein